MSYFGNIVRHIQGGTTNTTNNILDITVSTKAGTVPGGKYVAGTSYCSLIDEDRVEFVELNIDRAKFAELRARLFDEAEMELDAEDAVVRLTFYDETFGVIEPEFHTKLGVKILRDNPDYIRIITWCKYNLDDAWSFDIAIKPL